MSDKSKRRLVAMLVVLILIVEVDHIGLSPLSTDRCVPSRRSMPWRVCRGTIATHGEGEEGLDDLKECDTRSPP